jgi:hypothetical protein
MENERTHDEPTGVASQEAAAEHEVERTDGSAETLNQAQMQEAGAAAGGALAASVNAAPGLRADETVPSLTTELNNINFRKMIGGPLQAAVDAQVASSLATIDFINAVGFTTPDGSGGDKRELVMVDFTHTRNDVDANGVQTTTDVAVKVPLLAMLPVPSLRIEQVVIDFNVRLNSVESSEVSDKLKVGISSGGGYGPVNFKVSASYQRKTTTNVEVKREYALNVNVKAVQDDLPPGLEKVLGMLAV